ncbi:Acidic leucine-rich nuclear phosphoprotein 32-related protein [Tetrabaena socialis]|uniref:Acidic leucine-rich nuclear phosphoprotein 32-related protein n=1 Tax=Tetrabaena socialis TaxID=47790 RepID=A0A2J8A9R6_9CHLO|nr:Acidic leucine-rich nuclear phosphoprotein 32-related protein [Tetrabaena socialis]|eukprot:PNH09278.1 Acidic leucine-rich nuclear phosphoprotein 32-related protein [Tetrabaena socialis]
MKDIQQAIADELAKQKKQPEQINSLTLDSKCKSTHVKGLDAFVNVQSLSLCGLGLTSLEGFPKLPKLARLTLSDNRIPGGLQHLVDAGLTSLRTLELANNRIASLEELAPLKALPSLQSLDLDQCPCTKSAEHAAQVFAMLDELKFLDSMDKEGRERDGDEEEEDFEEEAGEEEYDPEGGGEGEEEFEDEEGGEFEEGEKEYAVLVGADAVGEDEEGDYQEEGEEDDDEGEEAEAADPASGAKKRKRGEAEEEEEEGDDAEEAE